MALNTWSAVLTDLSYVPVGELFNASERSLSMALNRTDTASFKIRVDNPLADLAQSLDCYLKLYRNDELIFFGLLVNSSETADETGPHIVCNAAAPGWVFAKRYPVRAAAPATFSGTRANIMQQLINGLNTQFSALGSGTDVLGWKARGETGIGWAGTINAGGTVTFNAAPFKSMADIIPELANSTDGFDWRILAHENWVDGELIDQKTGYLICDDPLSTPRPEAIFEFGDGRVNIKGYTRTRSRETQANGITHLLGGQPEANPVFETLYGSDQFAGFGIFEDIVQADLTDTNLREELVTEHLTVRALPRDVIQFTPAPDYGDFRLPRFGVDYDIGDIVTARARSNGVERFNALFRVWGVNFTIDEHGVETPTLLLQEDS